MPTIQFLSSGTWTCPSGVTSVNVELYGAGGGGGGGDFVTNGGGGGAGGFVVENNITVTPSTVYNVIVGAGGLKGTGTVGSTGGDSYFHNSGWAVAYGGGGGGYADDTGGIGGSGVGDSVTAGDDGSGILGGIGTHGSGGNGHLSNSAVNGQNGAVYITYTLPKSSMFLMF